MDTVQLKAVLLAVLGDQRLWIATGAVLFVVFLATLVCDSSNVKISVPKITIPKRVKSAAPPPPELEEDGDEK